MVPTIAIHPYFGYRVSIRIAATARMIGSGGTAGYPGTPTMICRMIPTTATKRNVAFSFAAVVSGRVAVVPESPPSFASAALVLGHHHQHGSRGVRDVRPETASRLRNLAYAPPEER